MSDAVPALDEPTPVAEVTETSNVSNVKPFFGHAYSPSRHYKWEKPIHRLICYMAAQGKSGVEIAQMLDCSYQMVSEVKRQPWALQFIAEEQAKAGSQAITDVFKGAALEMAQLVVDIAKDKNTSPAVRGKLANSVIDRLVGTAPQLVMHGKIDPRDLTDEELANVIKLGQSQQPT